VANWLDLTNGGNIIVAGYTEAFGAGWSDIWVFKVNLLGQILWEKRYGRSTDSDPASFIQQTQDSGYMVAGMNDILDQSTDIYLYKLDENGDLPPCISGFETHATNALVSTPILPFILIYTYDVQNTTATVYNSAAVVIDTTPKTRLMCPSVGYVPTMMQLLLD
jgi:hypothetical protein